MSEFDDILEEARLEQWAEDEVVHKNTEFNAQLRAMWEKAERTVLKVMKEKRCPTCGQKINTTNVVKGDKA